MSDDKFVIDRLFPTKEIHLIFGPSGAGKTTLLLQIINDWSAGRPVLDRFESYPMPFGLVVCDRSLESIRRHMRRLDIDHRQVPHISLASRSLRPEDRNFAHALTAICKYTDDNLKVLFIDGLSNLCEKVSDDRAVSQFMSHIIATCAEKDITVIATIRSSKARSGEGYVSMRERIIGSGAFCSSADCKIGIEPVKPSEPANRSRSIVLMPQQDETLILPYSLTKLGLLPSNEIVSANPLDVWLASLSAGSFFRSSEMLRVGELAGLSRPTAYRWLEDQTTLGTLIDGRERGEYQIPKAN